MTQLADHSSVATSPEQPRPPAVSTRSRGIVISICGLVLGIVALGLAIIPSIAFGRPVVPFEKDEPPPEREGGVTFKLGKMSINFGGKVPKQEAPKPELTKDPVRWMKVAAVSLALVGLFVAVIDQVREHHTIVSTCSLVFCVAAIAWEYVGIGIIVGVAIVILVILTSIFG